ncbi:MAG: HAD family hydrolase [Bacteroidetes bacterium]|nr:HAD family hydrolase [Bacteroidota bacterium]
MALNLDKVRVIYFDIDNTLVDHSGAEKRAIALLLEQFSHDFSHSSLEKFSTHYKHINEKYWRRLASGELTVEQMRTQRFVSMLEEFSGHSHAIIQELAPIMGNQYLDNYELFWELNDGASKAIESASQMAPLGLLSNGFRLQVLRKIKQFGWNDIFEHVVISEDVGVMKPHLEIFNHAMKISGINNPHEMLYIGDHYDSDIIGASNAGWQTVWVNLHLETKPDNRANEEITSIAQIQQLILKH